MILSEHVWKIGDWMQWEKTRFLVVGAYMSLGCRRLNLISSDCEIIKDVAISDGMVYLPDCDSWTWQPPATLQLKEGCWYERRDGQIVGPLEPYQGGPDDAKWKANCFWYRQDGTNTFKDVDLIREVPAPVPKYRPFRNADEFKPHRDKWIRWDWQGKLCVCKVAHYGDDSLTLCNSSSYVSWQDAYNGFAFEDGTPFGVKVNE